jgi:aldehyde dehydrogenase (NAD+)
MTSLDRPHLYLGGEWVEPASTDTIPVENPAVEEVLAHVPAGTAADVDRAVAAARAAFDGWAATSPAERGAVLGRLHTALAARTDLRPGALDHSVRIG